MKGGIVGGNGIEVSKVHSKSKAQFQRIRRELNSTQSRLHSLVLIRKLVMFSRRVLQAVSTAPLLYTLELPRVFG